MLGFLYTIIIFPIVQLIELIFLFAVRVINNPAIALLGVSVSVSIFTLPLYFMAEKHQQNERNIQKRLKPRIDKIKAVFKGDEQYMLLSTYYRQNHYHPVYTMRNTISLLIQIPFFIAAYSYLSHLDVLQGASFLFIEDLGKPDKTFSFNNIGFNILPLLMTLINIISGTIYSKGLEINEKIQIYGIAFIFLILLYNSPSALVLYWTFNNLFSLAKNILQKSKHAKLIIYLMLCAVAVFFIAFVIFFHDGYWVKRLLFCIICSNIFFLPLYIKLANIIKLKIYPLFNLKDNGFWTNRLFIISSINLFLLAGLVIPSSLIASSVMEFSFIEPYTSPFPFIINTVIQALGIFIVWPLCIYFLFSKKVKIGLTICMLALGIVSLINTFLVFENFGFLTNTLIFSNPKPYMTYFNKIILNIAGIIAGLAVLFVILFSKRKTILISFCIIAVISLSYYGIFNTGKIYMEFTNLQKTRQSGQYNLNPIKPLYTFSQTGKNVLFIMLDSAIPGYIPAIFEEKPELLPIFSGFTWYPNCVSFANHTMVGAPPLYGGYEYAPQAINNRNNVTILEKHKEAYTLLPLLFSDAGYSVTITDPPFDNYHVSNIDIFNGFPQFHVENLLRKYSSNWLQNNPDVSGLNIDNLLKKNLLRFSIFKMSPLVIRFFIYDGGEWLSTANLNNQTKIRGGLTTDAIDHYAFLDLLTELTSIEQEYSNEFTMLYSQLPHSPTFLQVPEYIPVQTVTNRGNGPFAEEPGYHVNMSSFLLLGKWLSFLMENEVYHNTRIIIVGDHGATYKLSQKMPNGDSLSRFNPILMVKDFYSQGTLAVDNSFMVNADAPLFAVSDIIHDPVNRYTNKPLQSDKDQGITVTTIDALSSHSHFKYQYNIGKDQWLFVKDNIFDPLNWRNTAQ